MRRGPINLSLAAPAGILAAAWAASVYRAATQAITHDEALTWRYYLVEPIDVAFNHYWTNHHILYTLLAKVATSVAGHSELAIRSPSLLGGALYFVGLMLVCRRLMGPGPLGAAAALLAGLNPFVLDFLVAARGYGLGLALLVWAAHFLLSVVQAADPLAPGRAIDRRLAGASILLGLSGATNFVYLFPGTALAAVAVAMLLAQARATLSPPEWRATLRRLVVNFALPGPILMAAICAPVLRKADLKTFDMGLHRFEEAASDLLRSALWHATMPEGAARAWRDALAATVAWVALPLAGALLAGALAAMLLRWRRARRLEALGPRERGLLLLGATATLTGAIYALAHAALGVRFPDARSALYAISGAAVLGPAALGWHYERLGPTRRAAGAAVAAAGGLLLAAAVSLAAMQFNLTHFREWRYDAGNRAHFAAALDLAAGADRPRTVAASWALQPSLNYYRTRIGAKTLSPIFPRDRMATCDLVILQDGDVTALEALAPGRYRLVRRDALAGTALLARQER